MKFFYFHFLGYDISSSASSLLKQRAKEKKRDENQINDIRKTDGTKSKSKIPQNSVLDTTNSLLVFDPLSDGNTIKRNLTAGQGTWKKLLKRGTTAILSFTFYPFLL